MAFQSNFIREYWAKIESGEIVACKRLKQQYQRIIDELDNPRDPWVFDLAKANRPIEFIEQFCRVSVGPLGTPVRLDLWEKAAIQAVFGFVHKDTGYRRAREMLVFLGAARATLDSGIGLPWWPAPHCMFLDTGTCPRNGKIFLRKYFLLISR